MVMLEAAEERDLRKPMMARSSNAAFECNESIRTHGPLLAAGIEERPFRCRD